MRRKVEARSRGAEEETRSRAEKGRVREGRRGDTGTYKVFRQSDPSAPVRTQGPNVCAQNELFLQKCAGQRKYLRDIAKTHSSCNVSIMPSSKRSVGGTDGTQPCSGASSLNDPTNGLARTIVQWSNVQGRMLVRNGRSTIRRWRQPSATVSCQDPS